MDGIRIVLGDDFMRLTFDEAFDLKCQLEDLLNEVNYSSDSDPLFQFAEIDNTICGVENE